LLQDIHILLGNIKTLKSPNGGIETPGIASKGEERGDEKKNYFVDGGMRRWGGKRKNTERL